MRLRDTRLNAGVYAGRRRGGLHASVHNLVRRSRRDSQRVLRGDTAREIREAIY